MLLNCLKRSMLMSSMKSGKKINIPYYIILFFILFFLLDPIWRSKTKKMKQRGLTQLNIMLTTRKNLKNPRKRATQTQ